MEKRTRDLTSENNEKQATGIEPALKMPKNGLNTGVLSILL